jgi:putative ABC transport system permease protein
LNFNFPYFVNLVRQILHEMWQRKLRSFLALFCILWGTFTIVMLLALGDGFHEVSKRDIMNLADGAYTFFATVTSKAYHGLPRGRPLNIKTKDIMAMARYVPQVAAVSPMLSSRTSFSFGGKQTQKRILGIDAGMFDIRKLELVSGRFIKRIDVNSNSRVVVLGNKLKNTLFGASYNDNDVIGQRILINHVPFIVVGVLASPIQSAHSWYNNSALIPYPSYIAIWGDVNVNMFSVVLRAGALFEQGKENIHSYLAYKYNFDRNDTIALKSFSSAEMLRFLQWFFIGIKIFLGICGALTLGVGSLGVANVMFLIVTERTREIGLRKAVGATDWQVLLQILCESLVITVVGGVSGFILAALVVLILNYVPLPEWLGQPVISGLNAFVVTLVLVLMGMLAGYFPARRAAMMDPVDALRLR